ncbi:MAG: Holliday junction resolvase RuvX [Armatimonadetes bacterium]|nr:Holliday junction resolvase RuvX [Armatimonadota bacterium]
MRALGVDVGSVRIGLAVSDETGTLCTPLDVCKRTPSLKRDAATIAQRACDAEVVRIVVGHPLLDSGDTSPAAKAAEEFAQRLGRYTDIPVVLWDERLSSFEAEERLRNAGVSARRMRDLIDSQAAAVILESYLNHLKDHPSRDDVS